MNVQIICLSLNRHRFADHLNPRVENVRVGCKSLGHPQGEDSGDDEAG
ncbi:MAG: hypothetical protein ACI9G1_005072, partial [Pirellulaceae bacterium]